MIPNVCSEYSEQHFRDCQRRISKAPTLSLNLNIFSYLHIGWQFGASSGGDCHERFCERFRGETPLYLLDFFSNPSFNSNLSLVELVDILLFHNYNKRNSRLVLAVILSCSYRTGEDGIRTHDLLTASHKHLFILIA